MSSQLFNPFDSFFADIFFTPSFNTLSSNRFSYPFGATDIAESKNSFVCTLDTPGLGPNNVKVEVSDDILTISGNRASESISNESFHRMERSFGSFSRSFTLPQDTDPSQLTANMDNGVLTVTIPKVDPPKPIVHNVPITNSLNSSYQDIDLDQDLELPHQHGNYNDVTSNTKHRPRRSRRLNSNKF